MGIAAARLRLLVAVWALFVLLAACGGSSSSGDGGSGDGGGGSTPADAVPTTDAGSGGGGDSASDLTKGRAKGSVSGDLSFDFELGVMPPPISYYDQDADNTTYLVFANTEGSEVLYLTYSESGSIIQYVRDGVGFVVGADGCSTTMDELDASHAKGSTTCAGVSVVEGEADVRTVDIAFTFDARE